MAYTDFLFEHVHPASLAVTRILFGFLMLFDIPDERGGAEIDIRWGDPKACNFPLFSFMPRPCYPHVCLMYGMMWLGALGICVGYKFRTSCAAYLAPYWYILLLDKSFWNNHSYLYGLLAILLSISGAGEYWSLDAIFHQNIQNKDETHTKQNGVPFWNYFLLRFQVFSLYFFAGLKKLDMEWLEGYSMSNMGKHWVFDPFGLIFTTEQIDYLVIHMTGFLLDLTVGFFFMYRKTRPFAIFFCGTFHLMNSRLFSIGMFPYVGIVTMPIFCDPDWPVNLYKSIFARKQDGGGQKQETNDKVEQNDQHLFGKQKGSKRTVLLIIMYCLVQIFLPWSHFITKGYNNWTEGLYGYSWDMMVHSWDTTLVIVRIVDNDNGKELFLDPSAWVRNDRWNKHADMVVQYAECVRDNFQEHHMLQNIPGSAQSEENNRISDNISIYVDVWCSLNGRFQQRMFHPHYDLLKANWSPFTNVEWLLPLLIEYSDFREKMKAIQEEVYSWSEYTEVLFMADFPDLYLENFITKDLTNISLVIIEGTILYESEDDGKSVLLKQGESISIISDVFHKIKTISKTPSCFMYTFVNSTKQDLHEVNSDGVRASKSPFPMFEESVETVESLATMFALVGNALLHVLFNVPMVRRARVE